MTRIAEVALFTADVPRLTEFYERLLGAAPRARSESHAYFDVGDTIVFIHLVTDEDAGSDARAGAPVACGARDRAGLGAALRRSGPEVTGPRDYYWGRSAYVRARDGRIVELVAE